VCFLYEECSHAMGICPPSALAGYWVVEGDGGPADLRGGGQALEADPSRSSEIRAATARI
jgi:hypothetical protein